jgi:hypothetical protein
VGAQALKTVEFRPYLILLAGNSLGSFRLAPEIGL